MEFGFDQVFQGSSDALILVDDTGEIIEVNRRAVELFGYSEEELVGENIEILVPEDLRDEHIDYRNEFLRNPETRRMGSGLDLSGRKKDGTKFPADISLSPFETEEGLVVMAAVRDITTQTETKRELRETRNKFEALFSAAPNPMVIARVDEGFEITEVNRRAREVIACTPGELLGEDLSTIFPDDCREKVIHRFEETVEGANSMPFSRVDGERLHILGGEGKEIPVEVNPAMVETEEERLLHIILRDLTEIREREKQLEVMDRVLRHNLLNSLNMVTGYAETIQDVCTGEATEYSRGIVETVEELLTIAEEQRDIIDVISERRSREKLNLVHVVRRVADGQTERFPDARIDLDLPETAETRALPDVEKAVEELIENAIIHNDRESPHLNVRLEQSGRGVQLVVADDGPGIPEEEVSVLTERDNLDPLFHGSGLGLWLVHWIVKKSGGDLEFRENEPRGSVITVNLPGTA